MIEKARASDEKDRAIITKCSKYQLRNDESKTTLEAPSKFPQNKRGGFLGVAGAEVVARAQAVCEAKEAARREGFVARAAAALCPTCHPSGCLQQTLIHTCNEESSGQQLVMRQVLLNEFYCIQFDLSSTRYLNSIAVVILAQ